MFNFITRFQRSLGDDENLQERAEQAKADAQRERKVHNFRSYRCVNTQKDENRKTSLVSLSPNFTRFRSLYDMPFDQKPFAYRIFVDVKNESIILPIEGQMVPFLIRSIKQITKSDDEGSTLVLSEVFHTF